MLPILFKGLLLPVLQAMLLLNPVPKTLPVALRKPTLLG